MKLFTIGFTKKSAETFFGLLRCAGVKRVVDVRLHNVSQLAGFAKRDDLEFFARELCGAEYVHLPELAPTEDLLEYYRKHKGSWEVYETRFLNLMAERRVDQTVPRALLDGGCLLCSEDKPHRCHRRLIVEYLRERWGDVDVTHLV